MSNQDVEENILLEILALNEKIEIAKDLYNKRDQLVLVLEKLGFKERTIVGKTMVLVDNFAEKNVSWRMCAVARFEIKVKKEKL